jgi:hypothetical protein
MDVKRQLLLAKWKHSITKNSGLANVHTAATSGNVTRWLVASYPGDHPWGYWGKRPIRTLDESSQRMR